MTAAPLSATPLQIDAVIFDMDGVVTKTATVHAAAWKELFDEYLQTRHDRDGTPFRPFDLQSDYLTYVDGKPRYEGVRSFLESRNIHLPYGSPSDRPGQETICGLGNTKDRLFERCLRENGVELFPSTISLIHELRARGVKVAIVSSSKNCEQIIRMAGVEELFDVRVDGVVSASLGLKGKPDPDIFLRSAELLGADPRRSVVVEDAISGVQAGRAGGFGLVVGVDRVKIGDQLKAHGADLIVADLDEVTVDRLQSALSGHTASLPDALDSIEEIGRRLRGKRAAVFLDYDGTLSPIAPRPELAVLSDEMREAVRRLAARCFTAIVSGRSLESVKGLVRLDELYYAGNHGFEIQGPDHTTIRHETGREFLSAIAAIYEQIDKKTRALDGVVMENKTYSLSVHYRLMTSGREAELEAIIDAALSEFPTLRKHLGKKVFEIRPKIDWHKGHAVRWLLTALHLDGPDVVPIYIGDDVTDEDAFRAIADRGLGLLVAEAPRPSAARYLLRSADDVRRMLLALGDMAGKAE